MAATSESRIQANRANSRKSTGPKTAEGKARSRRNALTHGMAGTGVVLADEDRGQLAARSDRWAEELGAGGDLEHYLVDRAALASVRLDRCARAEAATLADRARTAAAAWSQACEGVAGVAYWARIFEQDPATAVPRLAETAGGCRWLIGRWDALAATLAAVGWWDGITLTDAFGLLGQVERPTPASAPRLATLYLAGLALRPDAELDPARVEAFFGFEPPHADADADADPAARLAAARSRLPGPESARATLGDLCAAERDRLAALRDAFAAADAPGLAAAEARAGFLDGPEGALMIRYEAAHAREFHRCLDHLRKARRAAPAPAPDPRDPRTPIAAGPPRRETKPSPPRPGPAPEGPAGGEPPIARPGPGEPAAGATPLDAGCTVPSRGPAPTPPQARPCGARPACPAGERPPGGPGGEPSFGRGRTGPSLSPEGDARAAKLGPIPPPPPAPAAPPSFGGPTPSARPGAPRPPAKRSQCRPARPDPAQGGFGGVGSPHPAPPGRPARVGRIGSGPASKFRTGDVGFPTIDTKDRSAARS